MSDSHRRKDGVGTDLATNVVDTVLSSISLPLGPVRNVYEAAMRLRGERFLQSVAKELCRDGTTPEEAQGRLEANAEKGWVRDTTIQSCRSMANAVDDAVVPALGMLYAKYIGAEAASDRFFRGMCRLLEDLDEDELRELQVLAAGMTSFLDRQRDESGDPGEQATEETEALVVRASPAKAGGALDVSIENEETAIDGTDGEYQPVRDCHHVLRLIRMMLANDLAVPRSFIDDDGEVRPVEYGSHTMIVSARTARRISDIIGQPE